jgi:hypothetical protein
VRPVINDPELWLITVLIAYSTVDYAKVVSSVAVESNLQILDGKQAATRKNPPAIAVGLGPNFQLNSWYTMWMAT